MFGFKLVLTAAGTLGPVGAIILVVGTLVYLFWLYKIIEAFYDTCIFGEAMNGRYVGKRIIVASAWRGIGYG